MAFIGVRISWETYAESCFKPVLSSALSFARNKVSLCLFLPGTSRNSDTSSLLALIFWGCEYRSKTLPSLNQADQKLVASDLNRGVSRFIKLTGLINSFLKNAKSIIIFSPGEDLLRNLPHIHKFYLAGQFSKWIHNQRPSSVDQKCFKSERSYQSSTAAFLRDSDIILS